MTLTSHTDFAAFLEAVQQCRGEVLFCTREGDKLNLKSTLSKYLFAALAGNEELLRKGKNRLPVSAGRGKIDTHSFRLDVKANRE